MKKRLLLSLLVANIMAANASELTVSSYNIHHGEGMDKQINLSRIADVIDSLNTDVIALQEVDMKNGRSYFSDQARAIAFLLNKKQEGIEWKALQAPAIDFAEGQYGNAILYRSDKVKLDEFNSVLLPGHPEGDGARSAGIANFVIQDNNVGFQFIATHFTHKNEANKNGTTLQVEAINIIESKLKPDVAAIFAADFNATSDETSNPKTFETLKANGWQVDSEQEGQSVPEHPNVIDYIISRHADKFQVKEKAIIRNEETELASDHFPTKVVYIVE